MAGQAAHEPAHRALGETVDVLLGGISAQHRLGVEAAGQRQLAQDAVHARVGGQRADGVFDLGLAGVAGQLDVARLHAGLGGLLLLAAHVDLARLVVADQHGGQAHRRRAGGLDLGAQLGDDLVAQPAAVHQIAPPVVRSKSRCHDRPTISPFSSKSMIDCGRRRTEAGHGGHVAADRVDEAGADDGPHLADVQRVPGGRALQRRIAR